MRKKIIKKLYGIVTVFFLLAATASAETYYVSSSIGNDERAGTENDPWQTIQRVNEQLFDSGDIIHFKRGDTWLGEQLIVQSSGSSDNPITFTAYGEGAKPVFNLNDASFHGIDIREKDYIVIDGITIRNFGINYRTYGVYIYNANHIVVQNCTIMGENDVNNRGICIESTSDDIIVENNDISLCMVGVNVKGSTLYHPSNVIIRYNTIHDMDKGTLSGADGIFFESGSDQIPKDYTGTIIEYNHIYNCADQHIDLIYTKNIIVRYNRCHGTVGGGDGNGIKLSLYEEELASTGLNVYYNVVYDTKNAGIIGGGFEGNFYNNVVYNTGNECMSMSNLTSDNSANIVNNIFMNPEAGYPCVRYYSNVINTLDNNCYWKNHGSCDLLVKKDGVNYTQAQWKSYQETAYPNDKYSIAQDPLLIAPDKGNFELKQNSPCINSGADLSSDLPDFAYRDYYDNVVPYPVRGEWDIGANEANGDSDGIPDYEDNCPLTANGPKRGTCTKGAVGNLCWNNDECGADGFCSMDQEDADNDGIGDVCDNCPENYNPDQADDDDDGTGDVCDNCPKRPNGPYLGTCVVPKANLISRISPFIACTSDADCKQTGAICQMVQADCNENGIGDVCECYCDFNQDGMVTTPDFIVMKYEYGRMDCTSSEDNYKDFLLCQARPDQTSCEGAGCVWSARRGKCYTSSCLADINQNLVVSTIDYSVMRGEFGRFDCP